MCRTANSDDEKLIKDIGSLDVADIPLDGDASARLFVRKAIPQEPSWAGFFAQHIDVDIIGKSNSPGAVLLVRLPKASFLIAFGLGRHLIRDAQIERDFGLKVALNSTSAGTLRSIDKASHERTPLVTRTQASKEADLVELAINTDFDLLTAITGSSKVPEFGAQLTGRDALSINFKDSIHDLVTLLEKALLYFKKSDYKKEFAWVDNLRKVKDEKVLKKLDSKLVKNLKSEPLPDMLWLAEPEIIDWESTTYYAYERRGKRTPHYLDLNLAKLIEALSSTYGKNWDFGDLRSLDINAKDSNYSPLKSWSAYNCIYAEIRYQNSTYILQNGNWYEADTNFVTQIDNELKKITIFKPDLIPYEHDSENHYNKALSKKDGFTYMDAETVQHGGGRSKIEFCDVIKNGNEFIHVKRGTASSKLSHLFSQGEISAELFLQDAKFRKKLNKLLPNALKIPNTKIKPISSNYTIVFAIVSVKSGTLNLPFFSKIRLRNTFQRVSGLLGFNVALAKINVTEAFKKTSKYKP